MSNKVEEEREVRVIKNGPPGIDLIRIGLPIIGNYPKTMRFDLTHAIEYSDGRLEERAHSSPFLLVIGVFQWCTQNDCILVLSSCCSSHFQQKDVFIGDYDFITRRGKLHFYPSVDEFVAKNPAFCFLESLIRT